MKAAVDVGIFALIGLAHSIDHLARLLRGSRVVEIGQRLAMNSPGEDGKIRPDPGEIQPALGCSVGHQRAPSFSQASVRAESRSRMGSWATSSKASAAKADTRSARASGRGMPRERR